MNGVIQKCLLELDKETPRLDYIRGMLETLLEMQSLGKSATLLTVPTLQTYATSPSSTAAPREQIMDEADTLDALTRSALKKGMPPPVTQ